jgi:hypothetical protein
MIDTNCLSTALVAILLDVTSRINITVTSKLEALPFQASFRSSEHAVYYGPENLLGC